MADNTLIRMYAFKDSPKEMQRLKGKRGSFKLPTARQLLILFAACLAITLFSRHMRGTHGVTNSNVGTTARRVAMPHNDARPQLTVLELGRERTRESAQAARQSAEQPNRGMVLCAGGPYINRAISLIFTLRFQLGSKIPIELFYTGGTEMPSAARKMLKGANVRLINLANKLEVPATSLKGFHIKPLALAHSSFDEVLMVDADNAFFSNPEELFKEPMYKETGALFFRDFKDPWGPKKSAEMLMAFMEDFPGVDYKPTKSLAQVRIFDGDTDHQQDSSLVLWDKRRLGDATKILEQLATRYREELFQFMYGDKELFWMACELAGRDYRFNPYAPSIYGAPRVLATKGAISRLSCFMRGEWSHAQFTPSSGKLLYINAKKMHPEYTVSDAATDQVQKPQCLPGQYSFTKEELAVLNAQIRMAQLARDTVGLQIGEWE